MVDEPESRRAPEPAAWVDRHALGRPVLHGGEQRFLDRVFGGVEVT
jgi:hypothetical protein